MTATCLQLFSEIKSLMLATVDASGAPEASYAPFIRTSDGSLCVFISELASHTHNLRERPIASCLVVMDEASSPEIFARKRLMLKCIARFIPRDDPQWTPCIDALEERHGETVTMIRQLPDFHLVALAPLSGTLVEGFASATVLDSDNAADILIALRGS